MDNFIVDGYKSISNCGGYEIQLDDMMGRGRMRIVTDKVIKTSRWAEIHTTSKGDKYLNAFGQRHYLHEFMAARNMYM